MSHRNRLELSVKLIARHDEIELLLLQYCRLGSGADLNLQTDLFQEKFEIENQLSEMIQEEVDEENRNEGC